MSAPVPRAASSDASAGGGVRGLPDPVRRYIERALPDDQPLIRRMRMGQTGVLRTGPRSRRWLVFSATHVAEPASRRFCWDASVRLLPILQLRVRDEYADGVGFGDVRLLSAITVASDRDKPELNAASLHRYLAEAVWYPTALLPAAGVQWRPIDDHRAVATLADRGNMVSLEFRFNDAAEVVAVHTPARWNRLGTSYVLMPWEGRFSEYRRRQGLLVPSRGEVGWYVSDQLAIVWKGEVTTLEYRFDPAPGT